MPTKLIQLVIAGPRYLKKLSTIRAHVFLRFTIKAELSMVTMVVLMHYRHYHSLPASCGKNAKCMVGAAWSMKAAWPCYSTQRNNPSIKLIIIKPDPFLWEKVRTVPAPEKKHLGDPGLLKSWPSWRYMYTQMRKKPARSEQQVLQLAEVWTPRKLSSWCLRSATCT